MIVHQTMNADNSTYATKRLVAIDHFRAIAILMIVMLHSGRAYFLRGAATPEVEMNGLFILNDILFHNATLYFTLISGIVYARSLYRAPYGAFLRARMRNIVLPYAVISTALTFGIAYERSGTIDLTVLTHTLPFNLISGEAFYVLWYIPVIMIFYLISPILLRLVQGPQTTWIAIALMLLPLLVSREGTHVTLSTVMYFAGAYVIGLQLGTNLTHWLTWAGKYRIWLWIIALISSVLLFWTYRSHIHYLGRTDLHETLYYFQRIASGLALLSLLDERAPSVNTRLNQGLMAISSMAFGLYFLHAPLIRMVLRGLRDFIPTNPFLATPSIGILIVFALTLTISLLLITGARRLLSTKSRLLIGA